MKTIRRTGVRPGTVLVGLTACGVLVALPRPARCFDHGKPATEPYVLAGHRIVFTTWYHVRPGQLDWLDKSGNSIFTSGEKYSPVDGRLVLYDGPRGVRLIVEPAQRVGPIVTPEKPWEAMGVSVATLLHDEGRYRLWGWCQDAKGKRYTCYLESADLKSWTRPNLGQVEFEGSRDNNLLSVPANSVFKDPAGPPQDRYKAVWHGDFDPRKFAEYKQRRPWSASALLYDPGRVHSIRAAVSPDGLRWTELPESLTVEMSDTIVVGYYDPQLARYVLYTRNYMLGPRADAWTEPMSRRSQFVGRRAIGRTESPSFREFPLSEVVVETGSDMPPTDSFYTNCRTSVPGAPDHHLMFPAIYHLDRDTTSIELHASYDGRLWHRLPGPPVLETAQFGRWDGGCIFTTPSLIELAGGDWALPYTGYDVPHKYPRGAWNYRPGLAVWPRGRLAAIAADEEGEFTTVAVLAPASRLRINAVTRRAGRILIEAADLAGKPIPGRSFEEATPIIGDQFWTPVTWKNHDDLGVAQGQPVELRVRMNGARIYGLQFE